MKSGAIGGSAGALLVAGAPLAAAPATPPVATSSRQALLTALVDTIIPATDTPGAGEARVADFVTMMVERWLHPDERARFLAGLESFDATVRKTSGQAFANLPPTRRLEILRTMAAMEADTASAQTAGPFIAQIRALTIYGYYTSEIGASQELQLNLVPGEYDPCHDIQPGENAVSLGRSNAVLRMP
ncbi:hypothetical protein ASD39_08495 [Sphingomonas sp. Root50]|nr:hypothetical protein ASD17_04635 [Sphingomonas sp. Root1294]KQY67974.1 hypothetical protein ASD39_08495 [Sphingomonas sp. Root50]KRB88892.1 hypothetical protein ASE22_20845 [Sphingomonas sp. Root720]